mgnify:CR=1 FL=1
MSMEVTMPAIWNTRFGCEIWSGVISRKMQSCSPPIPTILTYWNVDIYQKCIQQLILEIVSTVNGIAWTSNYNTRFIIHYCLSFLMYLDLPMPLSEILTAFSNMRQYSPHGPLVNSEFYPGWLSHWNEPFPILDTESILETMNVFFNYSVDFNFYMFHGGTSFGFKCGKPEPEFGTKVTKLEWNLRVKG